MLNHNTIQKSLFQKIKSRNITAIRQAIQVLLISTFSSFLLFGQTEQLTPVFSFGAQEVSPESILNRPCDLMITEENIYVVDQRDHAIVIFNKAGKFINRIGRYGKGPGEFNKPIQIITDEDRFVVYDAGNMRIQVLTQNGECLKTHHAFSLGQLGGGFFLLKNRYFYSTEGYGSDYLVISKSFEGKELGRYGRIFGEKSKKIIA